MWPTIALYRLTTACYSSRCSWSGAQAQKRQGAQHVKASSLKMKAMEFEPLRWWCAAGKGNEAGALCSG